MYIFKYITAWPWLNNLSCIMSFFSSGYNTPHSGIASGVMTPADLDLPLDLEAFDDFPAGNGFQDLPPMGSSQPPPVTTLPPTITTSHQPQQHTHHYPPMQPQQMVSLQQGVWHTHTHIWRLLKVVIANHSPNVHLILYLLTEFPIYFGTKLKA